MKITPTTFEEHKVSSRNKYSEIKSKAVIACLKLNIGEAISITFDNGNEQDAVKSHLRKVLLGARPKCFIVLNSKKVPEALFVSRLSDIANEVKQ